MRLPTLIGILLLSFSAFGQSTTEIKLSETLSKNLERNTVDIGDRIFLYVNDGTSNELFYLALKPKATIKGTLILFPSTGETLESVINNNTQLAELAYKSGVLLVIPSINYNLCIDEITLDFLNTTFEEALTKYEAPKDKVVIGGFSLGGMNAVRYAELSIENPESTAIHPIAVYGIDPPLDWARLYYTFQRTKEINFSDVAAFEAKTYLDKLNSQFGGSPDEVPAAYAQHSMYSRNEKDGGNAKFLIDMPIRIYSDPDIEWHLKERQTDFYGINALDQTAMINQLQILGNENAEFISALGKGYRLNGMRHPHSWSIADPDELMEWIISKIE